MFKLQYYLLILTFSQVYKNQKSNIKIMGGGGGGGKQMHFQVHSTHFSSEVIQISALISFLSTIMEWRTKEK